MIQTRLNLWPHVPLPSVKPSIRHTTSLSLTFRIVSSLQQQTIQLLATGFLTL